jgi:hypothetical protein
MRPGARNRQESCKHTNGGFPKSPPASVTAAQIIEYIWIISPDEPLVMATNQLFSASEQITYAARSKADFQSPDLSLELTPSLHINSCAQTGNQPTLPTRSEPQKSAWIKEKSILTRRARAISRRL